MSQTNNCDFIIVAHRFGEVHWSQMKETSCWLKVFFEWQAHFKSTFFNLFRLAYYYMITYPGKDIATIKYTRRWNYRKELNSLPISVLPESLGEFKAIIASILRFSTHFSLLFIHLLKWPDYNTGNSVPRTALFSVPCHKIAWTPDISNETFIWPMANFSRF